MPRQYLFVFRLTDMMVFELQSFDRIGFEKLNVQNLRDLSSLII